jgi:hypothetical protein
MSLVWGTTSPCPPRPTPCTLLLPFRVAVTMCAQETAWMRGHAGLQAQGVLASVGAVASGVCDAPQPLPSAAEPEPALDMDGPRLRSTWFDVAAAFTDMGLREDVLEGVAGKGHA